MKRTTSVRADLLHPDTTSIRRTHGLRGAGGEYVQNGGDLVCRNEWGGTGNNDPGQSWVPWA